MRGGLGGVGQAATAMHAIGMQWIVLGCAAVILVGIIWYFETH